MNPCASSGRRWSSVTAPEGGFGPMGVARRPAVSLPMIALHERGVLSIAARSETHDCKPPKRYKRTGSRNRRFPLLTKVTPLTFALSLRQERPHDTNLPGQEGRGAENDRRKRVTPNRKRRSDRLGDATGASVVVSTSPATRSMNEPSHLVAAHKRNAWNP
jgi:hypothetical protein